MKVSFYLAVLITIFICCSSSYAQDFNLNQFVDETQSAARKTGYQNYFEFSYDYKRTREKKGGKFFSDAFEAICSKKRCERILVAEDGKSLSEKKVRKNRERAAKRLEKAEALPENKYHASKEVSSGYGFMINTSFSPTHSYFSPTFYLKHCQVSFIEKVSIENRPTVKLRAAGCNVNNLENKNQLEFMPKTEGVIWVDEQDKAVIKLEVYYKNKLDVLPASAKPVVMMKAARIPEGFWFWQLITTDATGNENFFPKDYGSWQIELYNYKPYTVLIDRVEIDKK